MAWSNVNFIDYSTSLASVDFTYSLTNLPLTPWPSHTAKKWVLLYSPRWGSTRKESWLTLFGFFGEYPVFVANANLVTQLSNFLLAYRGCTVWFWFDVVTSFEIEALTFYDPTRLDFLFPPWLTLSFGCDLRSSDYEFLWCIPFWFLPDCFEPGWTGINFPSIWPGSVEWF